MCLCNKIPIKIVCYLWKILDDISRDLLQPRFKYGGVLIMGNYQNGYGNICPICGKENISIWLDDITDQYLCYSCSSCGEFFAPDIDYNLLQYSKNYPKFKYNANHLKSYLLYHETTDRPLLIPQKDYQALDKSKYTRIYNLTSEMVENWYPKNFSEKIDKILLKIYSWQPYEGCKISIQHKIAQLLFCESVCSTANRTAERLDDAIQVEYILDYLTENKYLKIEDYNAYVVQLTPKALERIYELQKHQVNNNNVFIAMKFGKETNALREKIKEGLQDYNVRIMDEIEHNHQIVPEMLYEIRNSKFVIAELSNHNNGAYYEAGYALGLGKEVIHICKKSELSNGLHFDVAQVNTIVYDNIDEIPEKLKRRIKATIK